jgi:putative hydrolase
LLSPLPSLPLLSPLPPGAGGAGEGATLTGMTPVEALERVVHCLDRGFENGFKTKAFVRALDVVRGLPPDEVAERSRSGTLKDLDGIGDASARVVREALAGEHAYLDKIEAETQIVMSAGGARYRAALKGDLHMHSTWSDGGASITAMATTARDLGHDYIVLTDHSPRLTIAHGLDRNRLINQRREIANLNDELAPFRILSGMECDILEDGSIDMDDEMLGQLDVVVASVHSKLRMERAKMTERMVLAAANPHVDILGHCTGRMIGKRPPSDFDVDIVFMACKQFGTAVEINCRPERLDPPRELLDVAISYGCYFSIDSDAHATGQLEWQPRGCDRAAERDVPLDRVINSWPLDKLLSWTRTKAA